MAGRQHSQPASLFGRTVIQPEAKQESFKLADPSKTTSTGVPEQTPALHDTFNPAGKAANVTSCWLALSRHSYAVLADIFYSFTSFKSHQSSSLLLSHLTLLKHFTVKSSMQPSGCRLVLTEPEGAMQELQSSLLTLSLECKPPVSLYANDTSA